MRRIPAPRIEYSATVGTIHLKMAVEDMTGQDKVQLLQHLMELLGINERFRNEPDATDRAQAIITEQGNEHWSLR